MRGVRQLSARWQHIRSRSSARAAFFSMLITLLLVVGFLSVGTGGVEVKSSLIEDVVLDSVLGRFGYDSGLDYSDRLVQRDQSLILNIRLPRVLLVGMVGAALAMSGAALQGVFRNPLAEPGLIGVSSGAAVGAVTTVMLGWTFGDWVQEVGIDISGERLMQAFLAFLFGLLVTFLVYALAYQKERTRSATLLLIGLAVNAIGASYVGMATFIAGQEQVGDITFWTLGSAAGVFWSDVHLMLPVLLIGVVAFPLLAQQLNLMALGESEARYLGVEVERLRLVTITLSTVLVGIGVAMIGIISFVGLVVPHLMRLLFGPDHKTLFPVSFIGGATFLIAADLFARTVALPSEVPLGVVTTLVGGPFFLGLILLYRDGID